MYIGTYFYPLLFRKINEYTIGCVYEYECSHYNETASFKQFFETFQQCKVLSFESMEGISVLY